MVYCQCLIHCIHNLLPIRFVSPAFYSDSMLFYLYTAPLDRCYLQHISPGLSFVIKINGQELQKSRNVLFFANFFPLLLSREQKKLQLRIVTCVLLFLLNALTWNAQMKYVLRFSSGLTDTRIQQPRPLTALFDTLFHSKFESIVFFFVVARANLAHCHTLNRDTCSFLSSMCCVYGKNQSIN